MAVMETTGKNNKQILDALKVRHETWKQRKNERALLRSMKSREVDPDAILIKGATESVEEFNIRKNLSVFVPESPSVIDRIMGFLKRDDCNIEVKNDSSSEIERFIDAADRSRKKNLKTVTLNALEDALFLGESLLLIDRKGTPRDDDGNPIPVTSKSDEERLLGDPYVTRYGIEQLVNWRVGEDGFPEWIILREEQSVQESPLDKRQLWVIYRVYDRQDWTVFTIKPKPGQQADGDILKADEEKPDMVEIEITQGQHKIGMIPIVAVIPFDEDDGTPMCGYPFLRTALRLDMAAYRIDSDYRYDMNLHLHPHLAIKTSDPKALQSFKSSAVITLNADKTEGSEDAFYVSPPSDIFEQAQKKIDSDRDGVWIQTQQEAAARVSQDRVREQSGVHKRLSFEMAEGVVLSHLSENIVYTEIGILEIVVRYLNSGENPSPDKQVLNAEVTRSKSFDVFWITDYVNTIKEGKEFLIHSPKLMVKVIRRLARALLDSPSQADIEEIVEELDLNHALLRGDIDSLLERLELIKGLEIPSEELIKQLYSSLARMLLTNEEDSKKLEAVLNEIKDADIETQTNNEFTERLEMETSGAAG